MQVVALVLLGLSSALALCPPQHYWSRPLDKCVPCTKCKSSQVTMTPCQSHKDTHCAPISELNLEWPWLQKKLDKDLLHTPRKHQRQNSKHMHFHAPPLIEDEDDEDVTQAPKHKSHKKHYESPAKKHKRPFIESDDWDNSFVPERKLSHRSELYWKEHSFETRKEGRRKNHKKNSQERELQQWLKDSKRKLKHKKDDLIKNLKDSDEDLKLNHPTHKIDFLDADYAEVHRPAKSHNKLSGIDYELFKELVKHEKDKKSDKLDPFDEELMKSVVPAHRMFLGEPSTVSEIIGQVKDPEELLDTKDELENSKFASPPPPPLLHNHLELDGSAVSAVPFSAAETLVWDWQAIALASAVTACLFFFLVTSAYVLLSTRNWKRKMSVNHEEEMTTRVALMHQPSLEASAAEGQTTNRYLEHLITSPKMIEMKSKIISS